MLCFRRYNMYVVFFSFTLLFVLYVVFFSFSLLFVLMMRICTIDVMNPKSVMMLQMSRFFGQNAVGSLFH